MNALHFTLGPVQGFVSQARRTRDLWAGSFLLSYLVGHAMKAVLDAKGEIISPAVVTNHDYHDPLLAAIMGNPRDGHKTPTIGSLPNRFKARVPEAFDPNLCRRAIQEKWQAIAKSVWDTYVSGVATAQKSIWDEQVVNFWNSNWVIGDIDSPEESQWLDQRKNWRTHLPPAQKGEKCTLMGTWQELSGYVGVDRKNRKKRKVFWEDMRRQKKISALDIAETERLCAIALIKRLFPLIGKETIGWELDVRSWPSTSYFAAMPWLKAMDERVKESSSDPLCALTQAYVQLVNSHIAGSVGHNQAGSSAHADCLRSFQRLDGQLYYQHAIENDREHEYRVGETKAKRVLLNQLQKINTEVGYAPSPFYALLMMDGDRLGKLLQQGGDAKPRQEKGRQVSLALAKFTGEVDAIVSEGGGKTVYAGGDDVLALLPLDNALSVAMALRQQYLDAFAEVFDTEAPVSTISAGLCFAHYRTSLRAVREEAKYLLDDIAKEKNGRDSIAISVLTTGGRNVLWRSSWKDTDSDADSQDNVCGIIQALTEQFSSPTEESTAQIFASSFFYNVRQRFEVLTVAHDDSSETPQVFAEGVSEDLLKDLFVAEYKKSRQVSNQRQGESDEVIEKRMKDLLKVCRIREGIDGKEQKGSLNMQGALLVRFLATKGQGLES